MKSSSWTGRDNSDGLRKTSASSVVVARSGGNVLAWQKWNSVCSLTNSSIFQRRYWGDHKIGIDFLRSRSRAPVWQSKVANEEVAIPWSLSHEDIMGNSDTFPIRRLSSQEAIEALYSSQHDNQKKYFAAMYSSELGGIVTDPALMIIQMDDHMVHRGHGVFDTATIREGHIYQIGAHVERFLSSAAKANIPLPPGISPQQLVRTILETAAASKLQDGHLRMFLSAGRGDFELSGNTCLRSALYVIAIKRPDDADNSDVYLKGWRVKTSPVPPKEPFFAGIKSTNYLQNVLAVMDAEAEGYHQGIFVDSEGYVLEGPNMNVGIITAEGVLVIPPFENVLSGTSVRRLMEIVPDAIREGSVNDVHRIEQRKITVEEAKSSREVFMISSSLGVMPVVMWDDSEIGDGTPGLPTLQLRVIAQSDIEIDSGSDHTPIPYGVTTGMGA